MRGVDEKRVGVNYIYTHLYYITSPPYPWIEHFLHSFLLHLLMIE
jgi:hypothetical protein